LLPAGQNDLRQPLVVVHEFTTPGPGGIVGGLHSASATPERAEASASAKARRARID
jgi:hypothetical protein